MITNNCRQCHTEFTVTDDDLAFYDKVSPVFGGVKYAIPAPTLCPVCRLQQRTGHRNEQNLYYAKSSLSGRSIISLYSPDNSWGKDLTIYSHEEWWGNDWDGLSYGRDFDFTRPFFEQFAELHNQVPRIQLIQLANENSPFVTSTAYSKNCYLTNCSEYCEDCYYGKLVQNCRNVMDSDNAYTSELLYGCFSVKNCYQCAFLYSSQNCHDCYFSENLKSCKNCFLSTNLNNKEFYFMNEPMAKEEYFARVQEYLGSYAKIQEAKKIFEEVRAKRAHMYANIVNSENSTGDYLTNCKNCTDCFDVNDSEDCQYLSVGVEVKDVRDCCNMYIKPELSYQVLGTIGTYAVNFSLIVFHSQYVNYSEYCYDSNNLFGCVGLRKKQYCIFNKQYTKEEYEVLVPKIIEHMKSTGEWGEYFPLSLSPFGYNETVAQDYFPLTQEQASLIGARWKGDSQAGRYDGVNVKIPDHIADVSDDIVQQILVCDACGKNYRVIQQELAMYRTMNMPVARACPSCRAAERAALHNPRFLWDRTCAQCATPLKSTYSPERPEKIYCEKCYLEMVY